MRSLGSSVTQIRLHRFLVPRMTRSFAGVGTDEDVANANIMQPISQVASEKLGIHADHLEAFGKYKAKLSFAYLQSLESKSNGKLVIVTAMSPTKFGEGKTCTSVGLADGLCRIGKKAMVALREPSLGPVFGVKGGAAGGGYAQVVPMSDINLHFTGDLHAIGCAHNLLSALVDNHLHWANEPQLDAGQIQWRRVVDMNDRALRNIVVGLGAKADGVTRQDGYDITVASEVMAIFTLATDLSDLKRRLAQIVVGYTRAGTPVTVTDLKADGAMAALLSEALQPNIVQTLEKNPAFIHGGPFANIAHGCSSVIATKAALKLSEFVVTEGGFGADLGAEKFFDIKCRKTGLKPNAAVIVATVRALKMHGGADEKTLTKVENIPAIEKGMANLLRHCNNVKKFGVPCVVAINVFPTDTEAELAATESFCIANGIKAVRATHHSFGGAGTEKLAHEVVKLAAQPSQFKLLYPDEMPLVDKIKTIAKEIYGAGEVTFEPASLTKLKKWQADDKYAKFPICMAKNQYSFSADPKALGAPSGHTIPVRSVRLSAGAEFIVALTGDIMTMPGLPKIPASVNVGVTAEGKIFGLF